MDRSKRSMPIDSSTLVVIALLMVSLSRNVEKKVMRTMLTVRRIQLARPAAMYVTPAVSAQNASSNN